MILAVALLNKTIAKSSHYYWSPLVTYWFMVKKGRRGNCPLFNEVWPRRALCLYFCVLLCECVSDAANCPFAVYPMGSGMSLVTACSFSLNGPVAMAALQRPAPPPPSALRVTGQLEQGAVTWCSLLWLQLWGDRTSGGGGTIHRQSPNKIHLQTNTLNHGPWRSCLLWRRHILISPLHVAPAIKRSEQWYQQRDEYKLQHPEGSRHISYADRLTVQYYSLLEIFITCHTLHALLCYNPAQVCIHCERHVTDEYES